MPGPSFLQKIKSVFSKKQFSLLMPWFDSQWQDTYEHYAREGYAKNSAGYFAVSEIGQKCSEIPLRLWRKKNGEKVEVESHWILDLLQKPNDNQFTYQLFVQSWVSYLKLDANSFMFIPSLVSTPDRPSSRSNNIEEILLLQPNEIEGKFDDFDRPVAYKITKNSLRLEIPIKSGETNSVNHTKEFDPLSQRQGMSAFSALRYPVQLHNETNRFAVNFVKNRCAPPGLLTTEQNIGPDQHAQLERVLEEKYCRPENAGKPMVLWGGLKWQSMSESGDQSSFLKGRDQDARTIAMALGMPPILLGLVDAKFDNLNEAKRELVLSTCGPLMKLFADALSNWLLTEGEDKDLFLEPDIDMLPEIREWRAKSWADIDGLKSATINEKRELMSLDTKDGDVYNDVFIDSNTILASDFDELTDVITEDDAIGGGDGDDDSEDQKAITFIQTKTIGARSPRQLALYRKQYARIFRQIERRFIREIKKFFAAQARKVNAKRKDFKSPEETENLVEMVVNADSLKLERILSRHYRRSFKNISKFLVAGTKSFSQEMQTKQNTQLDQAINDFIRRNAASHVQIHNQRTKKRVVAELREVFELANLEAEAVSLKDLTAVVEGVYKDFGTKRAAAIARTETTAAVSQGAIDSVKSMQLTRPVKTWLADLRPTHRPNHIVINERTIPIDEKFEVENIQIGGVDLMNGPGDPTSHVSQLVNCICILAFDAEDIEV